jgi:NADH-quinone oxidoreductase subunit L
MTDTGAPALWLIPALPAAGALIIFLFSKFWNPRVAGRIACSAVGLSFGWVLVCSYMLMTWPGDAPRFVQKLWTWLDAGTIKADVGFLFDQVTLVFTLVVTGVGFIIHLYSVAYMRGDEGERRFFGYMNLFVAAMLVLVMADNAFFMFLGWEGVGCCSFFLIGHFYQKQENCAAATKAFLVTRLGDIFLLLGVLLCAKLAGVSFLDLSGFEQVAGMEAVPQAFGASGPLLLTIAGLLLLGGAMGKSAQLPLQTWLPDAMAGPTPVSALIHAATMVTAGVYLIARFHILYVLSPMAMAAVAIVGVATAFYAATCALVQTDIKRILAYSTISQIGYMILGLGVGAFSLGLFHFFTHAFYKALLFLAAGTVIHALHGEQNIYKMGGLKASLRGTYLVFLCGAAALAGLPLTAGFFSKDAILWFSLSTKYGNPALFALGMLTALLTAVYTFRLIFVVFHGEPRSHHHVHAPEPLLVKPLAVLAFFALFAGFLNLPHFVPVFTAKWEHFLEPVFGHYQAHPEGYGGKAGEAAAALLSTVVALAGLAIAWKLYNPAAAVIPEPAMDIGESETTTPAPYKATPANWLYRGWDFDRAYDAAFVRPFRRLSGMSSWVDRVIVDGNFELSAAIVRGVHALLLAFQNGRLSRYALVMLFGALAMTIILFYGRG